MTRGPYTISIQTQLLVLEKQCPHKAEFDWSPRFRLIGQAECEDVSELPQPNQTDKLLKAAMEKYGKSQF